MSGAKATQLELQWGVGRASWAQWRNKSFVAPSLAKATAKNFGSVSLKFS
jgi:hypothetical protein